MRQARTEKRTPQAEPSPDLLAQMGHEIRTPLNVVTSMAQLMADGAPGPLNPEQKKYVDLIARNAQSALRLLGDYLDLSRLETGQLPLDARALDLTAVLKEAAASLEPTAKAKGLTLVVEPPVRVLPQVIADPQRITQVLTNLLTNAIKFTEQGRVTISTELYDRSIAVHISDTGVGIPAAEVPEVLRGSYATTGGTRSGGAGLGLAISKRLVIRMGGDIWVTSTVGQGSRFSFTIPRVPDRPAEAGRGR